MLWQHAATASTYDNVTSRPLFTPGKDPVPIVQEAGWAPGSVWTAGKNFVPTGIRSPDRPARRRSLYRLSYLAHSGILITAIINQPTCYFESFARYIIMFVTFNVPSSSLRLYKGAEMGVGGGVTVISVL